MAIILNAFERRNHQYQRQIDTMLANTNNNGVYELELTGEFATEGMINYLRAQAYKVTDKSSFCDVNGWSFKILVQW